MNLEKFWDKREPKHIWSDPEPELSKQMMDDLIEWIRAMYIDEEPVILDVGCGKGRLFTALSKQGIQADVTMVDFTPTALELCLENTGYEPDWWDGVTLPYDDNSFNLVVLMEVALHVPPDKIKRVIEEAFRVSNQYVYITTLEWEQKEIKDDTWCFSHNYEELLNEILPKDALRIVLSKDYPAKNKLSARMIRVHRVEKTIMEAIEEQIEDDLLQIESEDERDTREDNSFGSDESSLPDDTEVG